MSMKQNESQFTLAKVTGMAAALLMLVACGGGDSDNPDPTVNEQPIAYVERPTPLDDNDNLVQSDLRDPVEFRPGARLIVKNIATLSSQEVDITSAIIGDLGDVRDPAFNYNGTKLAFALMMEDDNQGDPETWDIWEYDLSLPLSQTPGSENPRRIMPDADAIRGHEIMPAYLPGDRVVFSSSLAARTGSVALDEGGTGFSPTIEATNSNDIAMNIHVMDTADGGNLQQLTFNMSHDLGPTFIRNISGLENHIMFSRWENFGENQMSVYAMRPDGTGLVHLYGAHSHATGTGGAAMQFSRPRETSSGQVLALGRSFDNTFDGGDPVILQVQNYVDNTIPVNSNPGGSGPGQSSVSGGAVTTDGSIAPAGRYSSVVPMLDGSNRALVSYSLCLVDITNPVDMSVLTVPCIDSRVDTNIVNDQDDQSQVLSPPRYGIYVLDMGTNTILPITLAQPDTYFTDVAMGQGFANAGLQLDYTFDVDTTPNIGTIHIKSVYDMDGGFFGFGSAATSLAQMIDDSQSTNDPDQYPALIERPGYALRIVKGTFLPDDTVRDFDNSAFGLDQTGQLMRQIIGYAPIEPDGSVRTNVPADVPLSFSVVDKDGHRIGSREHEYWITVRPGEEVTCNGCHTHTGTPTAHGRQSASSPQINAVPPALNQDANTTATLAYVKTESLGKIPSIDMVYTDIWSSSRAPDNSFTYDYSNVSTPLPLNYSGCVSNWDENCRIIINYPTHIQPMWDLPRVDSGAVSRVCTSCHTTYDAVNNQLQVPMGKYQLDLTTNSPDAAGNSVDTQNADYFKSYIELLGGDNQLEVMGATLVDALFDDGQVDGAGNPIMTPRSVFFGTGLNDIVSSGNANDSNAFFEVFTEDYYNTFNGVAGRMPHWDVNANAGAGGAWLTTGELKMIGEWIDIGGQYYNDPFMAPLN